MQFVFLSARRRKTSSERSRNFLDFSTHDSVPSYDGRILVVGAYEAGKTSLVMNLIGEEIPTERQSTDGIDVHFGKLLFEIKTQMFLKKKTDLHSFPKAVYQKVLACLEAVHKAKASKQSKKSNQDFLQEDQCLFDANQVLHPAFPFLLPAFPGIDPAFINLFQSDFLTKINEKLRTFKSDAPPFSREVIPIPILDFAGQFVYYTTHQAFITSHGTYIVVFNGSKSLSDRLTGDGKESTVLDNIKHWVSSILAYSSTDTDEYPKIVFVATHKDLVKPTVQECNETCQDLPDTILNQTPSDEMVDKLSLRIGKEWMQLGLELGLHIAQLEQIEYDSPNVLREISRNMLYTWKESEKCQYHTRSSNRLWEYREERNNHPGYIENCDSFPNIEPNS
ncbi:unnamed protein product [Mytilus edulis]|uniref:Death domain-containing protein n=1 Tax=Mytilus edulis TaxID=6550 RepID=A0A8S3SLT2_MYTED|nr:unnamed protein product [Mytilus edulis]